MANEINGCVYQPLVEIEGLDPQKALNGELYIDSKLNSVYYKDYEGLSHRLDSRYKVPDSGYFDIYISPSGDDINGDGSSLKPFKTIFKAQDTIKSYRYPENSNYNFNLADGFYSENNVINNISKSKIINLIGNVTNPEAVVLANPVGENKCSLDIENCLVKIEGVKFLSAYLVDPWYSQIYLHKEAEVWIKNVIFTQTVGNHMYIDSSVLYVVGSYKISGGAHSHIITISGGYYDQYNGSLDNSKLFDNTHIGTGRTGNPIFIEITQSNLVFNTFVNCLGGITRFIIDNIFCIVGISANNIEKDSLIVTNYKGIITNYSVMDIYLPVDNDSIRFYNYPNITMPTDLSNPIYPNGQIAKLGANNFYIKHNGYGKAIGNRDTFLPGKLSNGTQGLLTVIQNQGILNATY